MFSFVWHHAKKFICIAVAAVVVAIVLVCVWFRWAATRGWTVEKLDRLVQASVEPNWNVEDADKWVRLHGFESRRDRNVSAVRMYRKLQQTSNVSSVVQGQVTKEQGANPGLFKDGELRIYFFYDGLGRLFKYVIYVNDGEDWTLGVERTVLAGS